MGITWLSWDGTCRLFHTVRQCKLEVELYPSRDLREAELDYSQALQTAWLCGEGLGALY